MMRSWRRASSLESRSNTKSRNKVGSRIRKKAMNNTENPVTNTLPMEDKMSGEQRACIFKANQFAGLLGEECAVLHAFSTQVHAGGPFINLGQGFVPMLRQLPRVNPSERAG